MKKCIATITKLMIVFLATVSITYTKDKNNAKLLFSQAVRSYKEHKFEESILLFKQVQELLPESAVTYLNTGLAYKQNNQPEQALKEFHKALTYSPHLTQASLLAADLYKKKQQYSTAIELLNKALTFEKQSAKINIELALLYAKIDDTNNTLLYAQQAIRLGVNNLPGDTIYQLAHELMLAGETGTALPLFEQIHVLYPKNADIKHSTAYCYKMAGLFDRSINLLEEAIQLYPNEEKLQLSLAHTLLMNGQFERGWQAYDIFLLNTNRYSPNLKHWLLHNELKDKKILLRQEGGLGDTLQFIRYARALKECGATLIACIPEKLHPLLDQLPYIDKLVSPTMLKKGSVAYDAHASIMSLACILDIQESMLASTVPYIEAQPELIKLWSKDIIRDNKLNIALCWQADRANDMHRPRIARRSIPSATMTRLAGLTNIRLYSLHTDEINRTLQKFDTIKTFGQNFDQAHGAFMDTAAIIAQMDLIISVDTALAHLAGAMGKPVWLLLPYMADWRWVVGRTSSPWYPTMKIFKQTKPYDWESVIDQVIHELTKI